MIAFLAINGYLLEVSEDEATAVFLAVARIALAIVLGGWVISRRVSESE